MIINKKKEHSILSKIQKNTEYTWKSFSELTTQQLYCALKLRQEIFQVEQDSVYLDADDLDYVAHHLLGFQNEQLMTYLRVLPPECAFKEPSIGRIVVKKEIRKLGIGKEMMRLAFEKVKSLYGPLPIQIAAQAYLKEYYETLGFEASSGKYILDGISHLNMIKK